MSTCLKQAISSLILLSFSGLLNTALAASNPVTTTVSKPPISQGSEIAPPPAITQLAWQRVGSPIRIEV